LEQAIATVEQARRRLEILGVKSGQFGQRLTVRAPLSGKVLEMNIVPGEFRNDLSAPVITIADLSSVWITSGVPETSIRLIQLGERIDIELSAYPGETFRGRVTRIADTVDPQTRTIKVRAEIDNRRGQLRPEMFGRIRLVDHIAPVPVVPAAAVIQGEGQSYVFRETGAGSFAQTPVSLGGRAGERIAVTRGLSPGDRIVTDGVMLLKTF
jgi:cobalt-zinc-cadmium efflux system membrane fusion protein